MDSVALIAPDFSIILLGLLLRLKFDYSEDFWKQAERLVFYVLFPPLLFARRVCWVPGSRRWGNADRRLRVLVHSLFGEG